MRLDVRGLNIDLADDLKHHIERRFRYALDRFADRIDRLAVRLSDINGPRGGLDKQCRIAVDLIPRGSVIIEGRGDDPFALVTDCARRSRRAVRRMQDRKRKDRALPASAS